MIMKNSLNEADCCYEAYKPEAISLFFLFHSLSLSLSLLTVLDRQRMQNPAGHGASLRMSGN